MCSIRPLWTHLDIHNFLHIVPNNFDTTFLLLLVENLELTLFLLIIHRADNHLQVGGKLLLRRWTDMTCKIEAYDNSDGMVARQKSSMDTGLVMWLGSEW